MLPLPRGCCLLLCSVLVVAVASCDGPSEGGATVSDRLFPATAPEEPEGTAGEVTLRNATEQAVPYNIGPEGKSAQPVRKSLAPGAVERLSASGPLLLMFEGTGDQVLRRLQPGTHYAFRNVADGRVEVYHGSHARTDVADLGPYVPTPMAVVRKMLELAEVGDTDIVYDIGCGDGRIVVTAAVERGARGVGIDLEPQRIAESKANAKRTGTEDRVEFRLQDATEADISDATVVTVYLLPKAIAALRPMFEAQLKPGTRVVSHDYQIPVWEPVGGAKVDAEDGDVHSVFLYRR